MKKILYSTVIVGLLSVVLFISGCSKVVVVDGHVATTVDIFTQPGSTTTTNKNYTYDQYGRQILQIQVQAGIYDTLATTYIGYYTVTDTTRSNGIVSTITYSLDAGLLMHDNSGMGYAYDNNGYLTYTRIPPTETIMNTILNGNTTVSIDNKPGQDTITMTNTYLTSRDYRNFGVNFNGKPNQNLANSTTYKVSAGGTVTTIIYTFTYLFDGQGRVVKQTVTGTDATVDVTTYTYTTP